MFPTFSIIIPAYNVENYISKSIESVMSQTFKDYELIIVDDCSTDNTPETIKQYCNLIYIRNPENLHAGGARNAGLDIAKGKYIIFLDSDDTFASDDTLEKIYQSISNELPDILYMGFEIIGHKNVIFLPTIENCSKEYRLCKNNYINVWSICWNRSFLEKNNIRFREKIYYEDVAFAFWGISKATTFKIADFIAYQYYIRESSSMGYKQFKQIHDTITLIEELTNLKDKIDQEYFPFLLERIQQQKSRILIRLDRVLDKI